MGFWAEISNHLGYSNGLKNSSCLGLAQTIGKIFYFRNILLSFTPKSFKQLCSKYFN
jgi:hypothetical protein